MTQKAFTQVRKLIKPLFYVLVTLCISTPVINAFGVEYVREEYEIKPGETLTAILFHKKDPKYFLYGEKGLVRHNKDLNPQIKNWNDLQAGTKIILEYPKPSSLGTEAKHAESNMPVTRERSELRCWSGDVLLGAARKDLYEYSASNATTTGGQESIPVVTLRGNYFCFSMSHALMFSMGGNLYKPFDLNAVSFPVSGSAYLEFAFPVLTSMFSNRKPMLSAGVEYERFSQASPNYSSSVVPIPLIARNTEVYWGNLKLRLPIANYETQALDVQVNISHSLKTTSVLENGTNALNVRGFRYGTALLLFPARDQSGMTYGLDISLVRLQQGADYVRSNSFQANVGYHL